MATRYDKDPYAVLGLPASATPSQVKTAFRRLARQYHPDLNTDPRAAERMKDINWAYSILGDPVQRILYDDWRAAASSGGSAPRPNPPPVNKTYTYTPPPRSDPWSEVRRPQPTRWSALTILWLALMLVNALMRSLNSSSSSNYQVSESSRQTLNAIMQELDYSGTLTALAVTSAGTSVSTPVPYALTRAPTLTALAHTSTDIRWQVTPGSEIWSWIRVLLPDYPLTTDTGLSDDVISIRRDLFTGEILIETRSYGSFRIYYDRLGTPQAVQE